MTPDDIKAATMASLKANEMLRETVLVIMDGVPERHRDAVAGLLWSGFILAYWEGAQNAGALLDGLEAKR